MRQRIFAAVVAGSIVCLAAACGTQKAPAATRTTSSTPTTSSASPTTSASATTSAGPAVTAAAKPPTHKQLAAALLALKDMPAGFSVEPKDNSAQPVASSSNPRCAAFVKLTNASHLPGGMASADVSFSGGQDGPSIDESLDALPSVAAAVKAQKMVSSAFGSCGAVKLAIPGAGTVSVKVATVSAPDAGQDPVAARMSVTSGPAAGFEATTVVTRVDGVLLSMTFVAATADDLDGATHAAVDKAQSVLGSPSSGA